MPKRGDPRIPQRPAENYLLLGVKLYPRHCKPHEDAATLLLEMLRQCCFEIARKEGYSEAAAEDCANRAALAFRDKVLRCRRYYVSDAVLRQEVRDAAKKLLDLQHIPGGDIPHATQDALPALYIALHQFFTLTRRSWTYLTLFFTRGMAQGQKQRLAAIYLGAPERQGALSRDSEDFEAMSRELDTALHDPRDSRHDPIERALAAIEARAAAVLLQGADDRCAVRAQVAAIAIEEIVRHRPQEGYSSGQYPRLAECFERVCQYFAPRTAVVQAAARELCVEIIEPRVAPPYRWKNIQELLEALPECHPVMTNPCPAAPAAVLAEISRTGFIFPRAPQVADDRGDSDRGDSDPGDGGPMSAIHDEFFSHDDLVRLLARQFVSDEELAASSPELDALGGFILARDIDRMVDNILPFMPSPRETLLPDNDGAEAARATLERWRDKVFARGRPRNTSDLHEARLAPKDVGQAIRAQPPVLDQGMTELDRWLANPADAPATWEDVPTDLEPLLRAALLARVLFFLSELLAWVYQQRQAYDKSQTPGAPGGPVPFVAYVLQGNPPPDVVVARIQAANPDNPRPKMGRCGL